jgi:hypothetical protein
LQGKHEANDKTGYPDQHQGPISHIVTLPEQFPEFQGRPDNFPEETSGEVGQCSGLDKNIPDAFKYGTGTGLHGLLPDGHNFKSTSSSGIEK